MKPADMEDLAPRDPQRDAHLVDLIGEVWQHLQIGPARNDGEANERGDEQ